LSFNYKNPLASVILTGPDGVSLDNTTGSNFSIYSIGGYMEVYSHEDLIFTIPPESLGTVQYTGNTIPIYFNYNQPFSLPNSVSIETDEITCGRRRLGMLAYVISADTVYQYHIDDYDVLWDAAQLSGSLVNIGNAYQCDDSTVEGKAFVDAWTGSTIEGVDGVTRENARWRIFPVDVFITGGTYYSASTTLELYNSTGGTVTITGFTNSSNLTISDGTTTIYNISGITFTGFTLTDDGNGSVTVSGGTSGTSGSSGTSGTSGSSGTSGTSGTSGSSGISPSYCGTTTNCIVLPLFNCTPTPTPSATPIETPTPTTTPTITQTPTYTPTETLITSPTPTPTNTETLITSPTPTPTNTETLITSPTPTETTTSTPSQTPTNTSTPPSTPSITPSPTPPLGNCGYFIVSQTDINDATGNDGTAPELNGVVYVRYKTLNPTTQVEEQFTVAGTYYRCGDTTENFPTMYYYKNNVLTTATAGTIPTFSGSICYSDTECIPTTPTPTITETPTQTPTRILS